MMISAVAGYFQVQRLTLDDFQGFSQERARQGHFINAVARFPLGCY